MKVFGKEHNQKTLRHLHDKGMEMTPDELLAERKAALATIRQKMGEMGHILPESDEDLFHLMRKALK